MSNADGSDTASTNSFDNGPHITVTDNTLEIKLEDTVRSIDLRLEGKSNPLTNGRYYNITGKTRRIQLNFKGEKDNGADDWHIYMYLDGSDNITFTGHARLIITGSWKILTILVFYYFILYRFLSLIKHIISFLIVIFLKKVLGWLTIFLR